MTSVFSSTKLRAVSLNSGAHIFMIKGAIIFLCSNTHNKQQDWLCKQIFRLSLGCQELVHCGKKPLCVTNSLNLSAPYNSLLKEPPSECKDRDYYSVYPSCALQIVY